MTKYYTGGDIAKEIKLTNQAIVNATREGRLTPTAKTVGGITLYSPDEVRRFVEQRARRKANA
jgi:hypothetical protein